MGQVVRRNVFEENIAGFQVAVQHAALVCVLNGPRERRSQGSRVAWRRGADCRASQSASVGPGQYAAAM